MNRRLVLPAALALALLAPAASALPLPPATHCQATVIGGSYAVLCFTAVGDLSTLALPLGPNSCATYTPFPVGTSAQAAATCCHESAGGTLLCWRIIVDVLV